MNRTRPKSALFATFSLASGERLELKVKAFSFHAILHGMCSRCKLGEETQDHAIFGCIFFLSWMEISGGVVWGARHDPKQHELYFSVPITSKAVKSKFSQCLCARYIKAETWSWERQANAVELWQALGKEFSQLDNHSILVIWRLPTRGWLEVSFDEALSTNSGNGGARFVIRDFQGVRGPMRKVST